MTVTFQRFFQDVPATTLAQGTDTTQSSMVITSATGWPSTFPFGITVGRNTANEEHLLVAGRSGTTLSGLTRDWENTGTTGIAHSSGETVELTLNVKIFNDLAKLLNMTAAQQVLKASAANDYGWGFNPLPTFTSTGARTSAISSPAAGDSTYMNTGDSAEGIEFYHGSAWAKPWNMPWGMAQQLTNVTSDQTVSAEADVTGGAYSFTAVANRYYRFVFDVGTTTKATAGGNITVALTDSGNTHKKDFTTSAGSTADQIQFHCEFITTLTAGSITWKWRAASSANNATLKASSTLPLQMWVEDIGPSGAAP